MWLSDVELCARSPRARRAVGRRSLAVERYELCSSLAYAMPQCRAYAADLREARAELDAASDAAERALDAAFAKFCS